MGAAAPVFQYTKGKNMEWSDWFQGVGTSVINSQLALQQAPVEIEKLKLQAYGPYGQAYTEGQANQPTVGSTVGAIPMQWLLIGGVVLLVMMND
jgi:hypothetical protein